ncbi:protein FAM184A-like [Acanthaster planci]|uniref:Protein FAM184A-like n=1 Tax=Acanthaster planci TaxID=133434 RepID=A0A8B8A311_ACAPL|nr:protein FAM184A-like [Acanthaster planci]
MAECGGASAAASAPRFNKKSFEFRMCKKVAELTQVVHMLFVKNHEREVELESVKMAYEEEIASVIADARSKIEKLQQSLAAEQRRSDSAKKGFEQNLEEKEKQLSQKLAESGVKVRELQKDNEFLRDQVVRLQRIVEDSESTQAVAEEDELKLFQEQLDLARAEIQEKTGKLSRLQEMIGNEADQRRENDAIVSRLKSEMEQMQFELSAQMEDLKNELLDASNSKEKLRQKNKNLESDIRNLKKELETRRLSEFNPAPRSSLQSPPSMDTSEELERLRREVRMYRMELSNREGNFNRMFTDSLPVRIDQRAGVVGREGTGRT